MAVGGRRVRVAVGAGVRRWAAGPLPRETGLSWASAAPVRECVSLWVWARPEWRSGRSLSPFAVRVLRLTKPGLAVPMGPVVLAMVAGALG